LNTGRFNALLPAQYAPGRRKAGREEAGGAPRCTSYQDPGVQS